MLICSSRICVCCSYPSLSCESLIFCRIEKFNYVFNCNHHYIIQMYTLPFGWPRKTLNDLNTRILGITFWFDRIYCVGGSGGVSEKPITLPLKKKRKIWINSCYYLAVIIDLEILTLSSHLGIMNTPKTFTLYYDKVFYYYLLSTPSECLK